MLLAEKIFLRYVAINFHRKALADRLAENHLGLTALDRLSNAHPHTTSSGKRNGYRDGASGAGKAGKGHHWSVFPGGRGHMGGSHSGTGSAYMSPTLESGSGSPVRDEKEKDLSSGIFSALNSPDREHAQTSALPTVQKNKRKRQQQKAKRGAVTSVIVDQLGGMIGSVALKDSKFNRDQFGSLASAGRLARKLFKALSDVCPPREHLIVEGELELFYGELDGILRLSLFALKTFTRTSARLLMHMRHS